MSMPSEEARAKIIEEIRNLKKIDQHIMDIVVSTFTGIPIASDVDLEKEGLLSAASATIVNVAARVAETIQGGSFNYIVMDFENLRLFLVNLGDKYRVLVIAKKEAPIGIVLRDVKAFTQKVAQILEA